MNRLIDSLAEAAVMYDEKYCSDKLTVINGRRPRIYDRYTDCFAVTLVGTQLRISIRGTDGSSVWQKAAVWLSNLFDKGPDETGRHPGFREAAEWILHKLIHEYHFEYIHFDNVNVSCHSRGTGIGVIFVPILAKYLDGIGIRVPIHIDAIAPVPGYNQHGLKIWYKAHNDYGVTGCLVINPRDMVTTVCRGDKWKDGADIFVGVNKITLPPDTWIQKVFKRIGGVHEHRPREYADGLALYFKKSPEAVAQIKKYRKMFVN